MTKILRRLFPVAFLLAVACSPFSAGVCRAEIFDRVVAFVDNQAITLSELREVYRNALKVTPDATEEEVLDTIVNRALLLREAKKYRIERPTPDDVIREYIDLKVRAFIKIGETEIEEFYKRNVNQFTGRDYDGVRADIEQYLTEKELNERLKGTLSELRKKTYIKVQLKEQ